MNNTFPVLLTPAQAQEKIKLIGRDKLYELLKNGDIEHVKVGRKYLIPETALLCFIRNEPYNENANTKAKFMVE